MEKTQPTTQMTPQQRIQRVRTALEQAKEMFSRLVNMKINRAVLPQSKMLNYAVASLPGGQMLMGNGQTKTSTPAKKIDKAVQTDQESLAPIGTNGKTSATIGDLLLQMIIPAAQMGTATDKTFAFTNYLNQILRPSMPTTPGLGAPALLPEPDAVGKFYTPSAIANLPPLVNNIESSFQSPLAKYGTFLENTDKIQKQLAQQFLQQFSHGERPAAYASMGGTGDTPIVSNYQNKFAIAAPRSATTATINPQTPRINAATIY
jgi:hypothetical protein